MRRLSRPCSTRPSFFSAFHQTPGRPSVQGLCLSPALTRALCYHYRRPTPTAPPKSIAPPFAPAFAAAPSLFFHKRASTTPSPSAPTEAMTEAQTQALDQLAAQIEGLSLDAVAEAYPTAFPRSNPLNFWRAHIANVLSKLSGVSTDIIFRAVSWTTGLDKGDFIVAVPALRVKGGKPDALAAEYASKVRTSSMQP